MTKGFSPLLIVFIVFALILGGYLYSKSGQFSQSESLVATSSPEVGKRIVPDDYDNYENKDYQFSLFYPDNMVVKEFNEGGGARTITFEDVKNDRGFQIFIVPYAEEKISDKRFLQDVPSGVRENLKEMTIDGAVAASFESRDELLGETTEVWFIHNGFLYEVTTTRTLGVWLLSILENWFFDKR